MTHDEFWRRVREAGPWEVWDSGAVRNGRGQCPLWAAAGVPADDGSDKTQRSMEICGLSEGLTEAIYRAADSARNPRRPLLLRELGLSEPTP